MREIVIDAETTGFDPLGGDRVVEIGAAELINRSPTGQTFHLYLRPQRDMPADALAVHDLTTEFLACRCRHVIVGLSARIAEGTMKVHRSRAMRKMKACSLPELGRMVDKIKLGPEEPQRS
jgi:DNA polymerase III subunit epsilon